MCGGVGVGGVGGGERAVRTWSGRLMCTHARARRVCVCARARALRLCYQLFTFKTTVGALSKYG